MKKYFISAIALLTLATSGLAQVTIPDYVRGSIYSIRLNAPSTSKADFSKEMAIITHVYDTLDYQNVYRKYNAFNAGGRVIESTALPEVSAEETNAIAAINNHKKANNEDTWIAKTLKYLNDNHVGRALVAKWFNAPNDTDYTKLEIDDTYANITMYGLMSLSEDQKIANKNAQKDNRAAAMELVDPLLNSTYVLVTKYDFATPTEQIQDMINQKLEPLYAKLEKAPGMLKKQVQGLIDSQTEALKQEFESYIHLNGVSARSYLFRLKWCGAENFQNKYIDHPEAFPSSDEFTLEYVTTTKGTNMLVTEAAGMKITVDKAVARQSLKVLNKNVNRLAQQYEPFAPIERLFTDENGQLYVKIGTQDGVNKDSKFTALKKDAQKGLVSAGKLKVAKDGVWNNNTDPDDIEANNKTAEDTNKDLKYTLLEGSAKGCSYVRFGGEKVEKNKKK